MADETNTPVVFSDTEKADIQALLATLPKPDTTQPMEQPEPRPRRGRGRPKGSRNKATLAREAAMAGNDTEDSTPEGVETPIGVIKPAPLTKRQEREVAERLANILQGATGMGGMVKPYIPMTDDEAKAIAEPLASYLIRNEPTNGVAREILENYDILAMVMGTASYGVRVYNDRRTELEQSRESTTMARVSGSQGRVNGRQSDEGESPQISISDVTRSGSAPFDV